MTDNIANTRRKPNEGLAFLLRQQRLDWVATLERAMDMLAAQPSNLPRPEGPPPAQPDTPKTTMPAQALRQDRMSVGLLVRMK